MMTVATPPRGAPGIGFEGLRAFERAFDPARPEDPPPGSRMVGFGEISIVFELDSHPGRVFKRVAGLRGDETVAYRQLVDAYVARLEAFLQWVRRPARWVRTRLLREPYDWVLAPAVDRKVTS